MGRSLVVICVAALAGMAGCTEPPSRPPAGYGPPTLHLGTGLESYRPVDGMGGKSAEDMAGHRLQSPAPEGWKGFGGQ